MILNLTIPNNSFFYYIILYYFILYCIFIFVIIIYYYLMVVLSFTCGQCVMIRVSVRSESIGHFIHLYSFPHHSVQVRSSCPL